MTVPPVAPDFIRDTLTRLVQINSINPGLVDGAPGEAEIAGYVAGVLRQLGLQVTLPADPAHRPSVVGVWTGRPDAGGRSLMLNAHLDTVGVDGMDAPFSAGIRDGRLYGRGAYDMKGALAACLGAAHAFSRAGVRLAGDLQIAGVADEEFASLGMQAVLRQFRPAGAIVTEPTALRTCLAHKGFVWLRVTTHGRAAHGSRFDAGIDANMAMGRFLAALDGLEQQLRARAPHPLVGPPSLHAATLHGGTELSMYAARCELGLERRTVPGETPAQVKAEIQQLLDRLSAADPRFQAGVETLLVREPFEVAPDAAIVRAVDAAVAQTLGVDPSHCGDTPWMDAALLAAAGVETVVIGPAGAGAHAHEEWVDLDSVVRLSQILVAAAVDFCGA